MTAWSRFDGLPAVLKHDVFCHSDACAKTLNSLIDVISQGLTPHITGSKKHSEERAALFAVRVHVIVSACICH